MRTKRGSRQPRIPFGGWTFRLSGEKRTPAPNGGRTHDISAPGTHERAGGLCFFGRFQESRFFWTATLRTCFFRAVLWKPPSMPFRNGDGARATFLPQICLSAAAER